jgi:hypothetical protein
LDFPDGHAARVKAQNLVIKALEPRLSLGDQLRLDGSGPISWHGDLDLAVFGQNRLRADAIAVVAAAAAGGIAFFVAEMLGQLYPESLLDQGLLQFFEKPLFAKQIFWLRIIGKQLIKQFRCNRRIIRHVSLP